MKDEIDIEGMTFYLCSSCCKSQYLKKYIKEREKEVNTCTLCNQNVKSIETNNYELNDFFRFLIRYYYSEADYNSRWGGEDFHLLLLNENFIFKKDRYSQFILENTEELFTFFIEEITGLNSCSSVKYTFDLYYGHDEHGRGVYGTPIIESNSSLWLSLKNKLATQNYYLFEDDTIKKLNKPFRDLNIKIKKKSAFYRSRIGNEIKEITDEILSTENKIKVPFQNNQISQPPAGIATEGRANRQGLSFLYLATDERTSICEVRPNPGDYVSTGKFVSKEDLLLINLSDIDLLKFYKSTETLNLFFLFRDLANDLSKPVSQNEKNTYLITQFLSDIIRKLNYDGLIFSSSLSTGENLVIFNGENFDYIKDSSILTKIQKINYTFKEVNYHIDGLRDMHREIE